MDADSNEPRLVIPPERPGTKARQGRGRAHVVPLAPAALVVVQGRLEATKTDHLFPQARLKRDEPMLWNFELMQVLRYQVGGWNR